MLYDTNNCFAKIIAGELPAKILYEDEQFLCFEDISPEASFHALVIPKGQYQDIEEFVHCGDDILVSGLLKTACIVANNVGLSKTGYRLVVNFGKDGGQTVNHVHCHILGGESLSSKLNSK